MPSAAKTASNPLVNRESRSRSRNFRVVARSPRSISRLRAAWVVHAPLGCALTPTRNVRREPCATAISAEIRLSNTVSTGTKSTARTALACAVRNCLQLGPDRRGAGSMPASCRICHTVEAAMRWPSRTSSPCTRRCPQVGFSVALRITRFLIVSTAVRPSRQRRSRHKIDSSSIRRSSTTDKHVRSAGQGATSRFCALVGSQSVRRRPEIRQHPVHGHRRALPPSPQTVRRRPRFQRPQRRHRVLLHINLRPIAATASPHPTRTRFVRCRIWLYEKRQGADCADAGVAGLRCVFACPAVRLRLLCAA
jgi:hypothetical protein